MNIIKRSGMEVTFDSDKIEEAVKKANASVQESDLQACFKLHYLSL